jgi:hypothetical protein
MHRTYNYRNFSRLYFKCMLPKYYSQYVCKKKPHKRWVINESEEFNRRFMKTRHDLSDKKYNDMQNNIPLSLCFNSKIQAVSGELFNNEFADDGECKFYKLCDGLYFNNNLIVPGFKLIDVETIKVSNKNTIILELEHCLMTLINVRGAAIYKLNNGSLVFDLIRPISIEQFFKYIPEKYITNEMIEYFSSRIDCNHGLSYIPEKFRTKKVCELALFGVSTREESLEWFRKYKTKSQSEGFNPIIGSWNGGDVCMGSVITRLGLKARAGNINYVPKEHKTQGMIDRAKNNELFYED